MMVFLYIFSIILYILIGTIISALFTKYDIGDIKDDEFMQGVTGFLWPFGVVLLFCWALCVKPYEFVIWFHKAIAYGNPWRSWKQYVARKSS